MPIDARVVVCAAFEQRGVAPAEVEDKLNANAAKRQESNAALAAADGLPPLTNCKSAEGNWRGLGTTKKEKVASGGDLSDIFGCGGRI